jgi:small-conductance mechanosensitive channel
MKRTIHCLLAAAVLAGTGLGIIPPASAQEVAQPTRPSSLETAAVTIDGSFLFHLRGVSAYSAEDRAQVVMQRIVNAARSPAVTPEMIVVTELPDRSDIVAGKTLIVSIFDVDAELEGVDRPLLAEAVRQQVRDAVEQYRGYRSPKSLATYAAYAVATTLAFAIALVVFFLFMRFLNRFAAARHLKYIAPLEAKSSRIVRADQVWKLLRAVLRTLWVIIFVILVYAYLEYLLGLFPWTRELSIRLSGLVSDRLLTVGVAILDALPDLLLIAILILITRYVLKITRMVFDAVKDGRLAIGRFLPEWADPTYKIARLVIVAFAFVIAYPYLPGSGTAAFHGVSIFLGVLLSLGSSSLISNVIAGHTLVYRRAFHVGDMVKIQDTIGEIVETSLLVTRLRTPKNEFVVIPNSLILNNQLLNYSELARKNGIILSTTVGIGYEVPWRQTEAMLLLAAERTAGIAREPAPFVHQLALDDFDIKYELNVHCQDAHAMLHVRTALHRNILDLFNEHGVQIMTPAYEGDPETPKIVPRDRWFAPPARPDDAGADGGS